MFSRKQAIKWAELWVTSWNEHDLDTVLMLYRDDVRFESPMAEVVMGSSLVEGKAALARYWGEGPYGMHSVRLDLERVIWDSDAGELAILYVADFEGTRVRGCDLITLDAEGRAVRGEACVGSVMEGGRPCEPIVDTLEG